MPFYNKPDAQVHSYIQALEARIRKTEALVKQVRSGVVLLSILC